VPSGPGLGVTINPVSLKKFTQAELRMDAK
jgi:hypothetical protein